MEKRLLLAFLLSLFVVSLWSALTPRQNNQELALNSLLTSEKSPVAEPETSAIIDESGADNAKINSEMSILDIPKDHFKLENDKLIVDFSALGGAIKNVKIKEFEGILPLNNILAIAELEDERFKVENITEDNIEFKLIKDGVEYIKRYKLDDGYLIHAYIQIINKTNQQILDKIRLDNIRLDISKLDNKNTRDFSLTEYAVAEGNTIFRKGNLGKFSKKEFRTKQGPVRWIGFRNHYFCAVVKPEYEINNYNIIPENEHSLTIQTVYNNEKGLFPEESLNFQHIIYFGPQNLSLLKSYGQGIEDIMAFSNWGILDFVAKIIYNTIIFIHKYIPSWGLCILIISLSIYGLTYPLTLRGMTSMKKMQALQPIMAQLREKYKNNPQKLNQEMLELYKEHRVNPLGGCFPFVLQMPIFIGLYQVLWRSVHFRGEGFLWIKDLSQPDRLVIFPFNIPIIGNELNILPIIMMVIMFFQQRLSSKNIVVTDPAQIAQQKMMSKIFPVFLGFIFYKFASGLCLYFVVFYLMSTFTQWKLSLVNMS